MRAGSRLSQMLSHIPKDTPEHLATAITCEFTVCRRSGAAGRAIVCWHPCRSERYGTRSVPRGFSLPPTGSLPRKACPPQGAG